MTAYNILEARNNLSRLIAEVESGAEVTLMRRGKPVARIVPVDELTGRGSSAGLAEWFAANPLPASLARTPEEIEADIREMRGAGA